MELINENDPILTTVTKQFDFDNPPVDTTKLADEMLSYMFSLKGIGLAAPQVGLPHRMFVMGTETHCFAVFNPVIDSTVGETKTYEGCLTYPGLFIKIPRAEQVAAVYQDEFGVEKRVMFDGILARAFQHELNHLDGILFMKKASKINLNIAKRKLAKQQRKIN